MAAGTQCKYCLRTENLKWVRLPGGRFKMFEMQGGTQGRPHECDEFKRQAAGGRINGVERPQGAVSDTYFAPMPGAQSPGVDTEALENLRQQFSTLAAASQDGIARLATEQNQVARAVAAVSARVDALNAERRVTVERGSDLPAYTLPDLVHRDFEELLLVLLADGNVWLHGPAGTFKTSTAERLAEAIFPDRTPEERFFPQSVNRQTTKSDILGYTTATGEYVESALYKARKRGGLWLIDECDAANENALTCANAAVENDFVIFPNGELVAKHPDFYVVAAGNTVGKGAEGGFLGRNAIDAATISRFSFFRFDADWDMTRVICERIAGEAGVEWCDYVKRVDERVLELRLPHPVGPRAAVKGAKLIAAGVSKERAAELRIFGSLKRDSRDMIEAGL